jgi:hypothetical protein
MVEVTYQMVLSTLQTVALVVGISYYIMVLRNQQKSHKHAEDTRKIQLLHEINQFATDPNLPWKEMMDMEWDDYEDFISKYGFDNNPDHYTGMIRIWRNLNLYGLLIDEGLIDISTYVRVTGVLISVLWKKFGAVIEEMRRVQDNPEHLIGMEILARETDSYHKSKSLKPKLLWNN